MRIWTHTSASVQSGELRATLLSLNHWGWCGWCFCCISYMSIIITSFLSPTNCTSSTLGLALGGGRRIKFINVIYISLLDILLDYLGSCLKVQPIIYIHQKNHPFFRWEIWLSLLKLVKGFIVYSTKKKPHYMYYIISLLG